MNEPLINPYDTRGMIREARQFFGRKRELRETFGRLATMQSVSVVGERRIGKSSFLHRLTAPSNGEAPPDVRLYFLDLQRVFSADEFYRRACKLIGSENGEAPRRAFEEALQNRRVVLCLDEFEQAYKQDFGDEFFNAMRSYAQEGNLALVVATETPLNQLDARYLRGQDATSRFNNIFTPLPLGELTDEEAREMVAAPRGEFSFTKEEVESILARGERKPLALNQICAERYAAQHGYPPIAEPAAITPPTAPAVTETFAPPSAPPTTYRSDVDASASWGIRIGLIGVIVSALSSKAGLEAGMYLSFALIAVALWLLLKGLSWRGGTV